MGGAVQAPHPPYIAIACHSLPCTPKPYSTCTLPVLYLYSTCPLPMLAVVVGVGVHERTADSRRADR